MTGTASAFQLPHTVASGAAQMTADGALLAWASDARARVVFRTYSWARPTLSLGRAEPFPSGWDEGALRAAGIDVVRRPTGGDAVLHEGELTFAVAASLPGPWELRPRAFADLVADALAGALRAFDLPAERIAEGDPSGITARPGQHPCFARAAAGEVRIGSFKVAGIASRFTRGAALSHASVPLSARHRDVAAFRAEAARERAELDLHARAATEISGRELPVGALGGHVAEHLAALLRTVFTQAAFAELAIPEPGGP